MRVPGPNHAVWFYLRPGSEQSDKKAVRSIVERSVPPLSGEGFLDVEKIAPLPSREEYRKMPRLGHPLGTSGPWVCAVGDSSRPDSHPSSHHEGTSGRQTQKI